jgi:hypothetical protein
MASSLLAIATPLKVGLLSTTITEELTYQYTQYWCFRICDLSLQYLLYMAYTTSNPGISRYSRSRILDRIMFQGSGSYLLRLGGGESRYHSATSVCSPSNHLPEGLSIIFIFRAWLMVRRSRSSYTDSYLVKCFVRLIARG